MRKYVVMLSLAICGCASPNYNYRPTIIAVSEPPVGQVTIVRIGDTLVRQGTYTNLAAIKINEPIKLGPIVSYTLEPGYYLKQGEDATSEFYMPEQGPEGGHIRQSALADPFQAIQVLKSTQKICGVSVFNLHVCKENAPFDRTQRPNMSSSSFQQELIYSGRVGDKLHIGYRELSNNMARPAFNNEVEYDLSSGPIIAYKGARIEVLEATNEEIKFRLISNFNSDPVTP